MKRVIMHWTGGSHTASSSDTNHYHWVVEGSGNVVAGKFKPEDNLDTQTPYAAHTRRLNTGSIGVAMCSMHRAKERPLEVGAYPITKTQLDSFVEVVADLCIKYNIKVTRKTVLTHAEVQPTLGVKQSSKWDICWLPEMGTTSDPVMTGDIIRSKIIAVIEYKTNKPKTSKPLANSREILAGVAASTTAVGGLAASLTPVAQNLLVGGLILALVVFGGFVIYNRVKARKDGER